MSVVNQGMNIHMSINKSVVDNWKCTYVTYKYRFFQRELYVEANGFYNIITSMGYGKDLIKHYKCILIASWSFTMSELHAIYS